MLSWKKLKNTNFVNATRIKITIGNPYLKYPHYFFCSFQKSGRTWMRFMLGNYYNMMFSLGLDLNFQNLYALLPPLSDKKLIGSAYQLLKNEKLPLIFFTHSRYNPFLFNNRSTLFMIRSVYDTMVSFYFHNTKHHNNYNKGIKDFIRDPSLGVTKWINYINSWSHYINSSNSCIISYENLYSNTRDELTRLLEYLSLPIDIKIINKTIENSSFNKMQNIEIIDGIAKHNHDRSNQEARRMRKGKIEGYLDYLDNQDLDYINVNCKKYLKNKSKDLIDSFIKN